MVLQEDFQVERWMDTYETKVDYNIAETCCASISIADLERFSGDEFSLHELRNRQLTYGSIRGSDYTRSLIADVINEPQGGQLKVTKDDIILTNGAIGANFLVYYAFCGPGDNVIVVDPAYQQLHSVPALFGANVHKLPLRAENEFQIDLDELRRMVSQLKPKLININSPHNPTGTCISDKDLNTIVELAKMNDSYLLCDEVYRPLYHSAHEFPHSVATLYDKGIITGSMSKAFSMAGLRLGWVASTNKDVIEECCKRRDYNIISTSMVDDFIAGWTLEHRSPLLDRNYELCKNNLETLRKYKNRPNGKLWYVEPTGGTTVLIKIEGVDDTIKFCHELAINKKVLLVPGETFGFPGFVRLGYANDPKDLEIGLERFVDFVNEQQS